MSKLKEMKKICENGDLTHEMVYELAEKVDRYEKAIKKVIEYTYDDDAHEFLNRLLEGKENEAPSYRMTLSPNVEKDN